MRCREIPWARSIDEEVNQAQKKVAPKIGAFSMHLWLWGGALAAIYFASLGREQDNNRFYLIGSLGVAFVGYLLMYANHYLENNVLGLTCVYFMDDCSGSAMSRISCNTNLAVGKVHFRFPLSGWWWRRAVVVDGDGDVIKHLRLHKNNKRGVWTLTEDDGCNAMSEGNVDWLLATFISCHATLGSIPYQFLGQVKEITRLKEQIKEKEAEARDSLSRAREQHLVTNNLLDLLGTFCAEAVVVSGHKDQPVKKQFKIGSHAGSFAARLLTMMPETKVASWYAAAEENIKQRAGSELTTTR